MSEKIDRVLFRPDYRDYLRAEFELRRARRPHYSLRAYARDLQLSPSTLSELLSGRYVLSRVRALSVGKRIQLTEPHLHHFADLMEMKKERASPEKNLASLRVKHRLGSAENKLRLETFRVVADWYHFAILELFYVEGFLPEPKWIARTLNLKVSTVKEALLRLEKVGMIVVTPTGFRLAEANTFVGDDIPSEAIRIFHRQILEKATAAIFNQSIEERELNASILSLRKKDLPALKKEIRRFANEMGAKFGGKKSRDSVYCLALQCFSLANASSTQGEKDEKSAADVVH